MQFSSKNSLEETVKLTTIAALGSFVAFKNPREAEIQAGNRTASYRQMEIKRFANVKSRRVGEKTPNHII